MFRVFVSTFALVFVSSLPIELVAQQGQDFGGGQGMGRGTTRDSQDQQGGQGQRGHDEESEDLSKPVTESRQDQDGSHGHRQGRPSHRNFE